MKKELQEKLFKDFPKIFKYTKKKTKPIIPMAFGCECGDGWYPLINSLCKTLQWQVDNNKEPQPVAVQVKEKFGGLRFYIESGSDKIYDIISVYENISFIVCEECGMTTSTTKREKNHWMFTLCDACWIKRC